MVLKPPFEPALKKIKEVLEEWKSGRVEEWKSGILEEWNIGRVE